MNQLSKLVIVVFFVLLYIVIDDIYIALGLVMTLYFFLSFLNSLGEQIPILELLILLALSQWVLGPYLDYITPETHFKYYMYVEPNEYFPVVVPALVCFVLPIILLKKPSRIRDFESRIKQITMNNVKLPWLLIITGFVADVGILVAPSALLFVFFILGQFKYIGLIYMFFSDVEYDKYILYGLSLLTILLSVVSGFFHDLLLWAALFSTFLVYRYNWSMLQKSTIIVLGLGFGVVTQSIKSEYREIIFDDPDQASIQLFGSMAYSELIEGNMFSSGESLNELNVRLNQGWIISAIIDNVPKNEPFAEGETIENAISASLLPRFLVADKKQAGGRENFMRFTGLLLMESTSMGTSILGEAYGNYGSNGSLVFMFLWGLFLVLVYNFIMNKSIKFPSLILWLPLIFLQALKAETELVVVLNHILKSGILIFLFFWFVTKTLKWKL